MPLVKQGKISGDAFVHVADDVEIPAGAAVLISAARFLADPETLSRRLGKTGVIWPNNRDVDDLVPYLDKLAVVALVFPTFRDGRAYSQARLLRERYAYRGELRATGRYCVTSSCSCCAPASTRSRSRRTATPKRSSAR
jgi:uncharacterized protein (DUF934 family)